MPTSRNAHRRAARRRRSATSSACSLSSCMMHALLDAIDPGYSAFVLTGVSTGLRLGELIGLQWGDVDHAQRRLHVRRTHWKGQDFVPKTKTSRRAVDLGDQLLATLSRLARERFGEEPVPAE